MGKELGIPDYHFYVGSWKSRTHPSDVLCDDMGTWVCTECRSTMDVDGELDKNKPKDREN